MSEKNEFFFVKWMDAVSVDDWSDRTEAQNTDLVEVHSVGILIYQDETKITLALNHDIDNDKCSCVMTIPTGMIVSMQKLNPIP